MRSACLIAFAMLLGPLLRVPAVEACSSLQVRPELWTFVCECCCEDGDDGTVPDVLAVSGTILLDNRQAAPTLASLVVTLETKAGGSYTPVADRVLNANGDDVVATCQGAFADGPFPGQLELVDEDGTPVSFASVAALPEGRTALRYRATFAGDVPGLEPGGRIRVRTRTSLIGADASRTCAIDADNDGMIEQAVKTHVDRSTIRVPAAPIVLPCPD